MLEKISIVKANSLIETSYNLGKRELLWILMQLGEINTDPENMDDELPRFKMSGSEIMRRINFDGKRRIADTTEVVDIMKNLNNNPITWETDKKMGFVSWIAYMEYDKDKDEYEWEIPRQLKPFLLQLKKNFTQYTLNNIIRLKSAHAINLYEVLKRYQFKKSFIVKVDRLKFWLGLEGSYKAWQDFKVRVLLPCQKQINTFTDIHVKYTMLKTGRRVTSLRFTITKNPKYVHILQKQQIPHLPTPIEPKTEAAKKLRQKLKAFALSEANIQRINQHYSEKQIWDAIRYTDRATKVRNKAGYLLKHLEERWMSAEEIEAQQKKQRKQALAKQKRLIAQLTNDLKALQSKKFADKQVIYEKLCANKQTLYKAYNLVKNSVMAVILQGKGPEACLKDNFARSAIYGQLEKIFPKKFAHIDTSYEKRITAMEQQIAHYKGQKYEYFLT